MCNIVNIISCFCLIFFLEGIGGGFRHATPLVCTKMGSFFPIVEYIILHSRLVIRIYVTVNFTCR